MNDYNNLSIGEKKELLEKKKDLLKQLNEPSKAEKMIDKAEPNFASLGAAIYYLIGPALLFWGMHKFKLTPFFRDLQDKAYYQHIIQDSNGENTLTEGYELVDVLGNDSQNHKDSFKFVSKWQPNEDGSYSQTTKIYHINISKESFKKIIDNIDSGNIDDILGEPASQSVQTSNDLTPEEINSDAFWEVDFIDTDPEKAIKIKEDSGDNIVTSLAYVFFACLLMFAGGGAYYYIGKDLHEMNFGLLEGHFYNIRREQINELRNEIDKLEGIIDQETLDILGEGLDKLEKLDNEKNPNIK